MAEDGVNLTKALGQWGEDIACKYLESKGYVILERNFRRKWGEIDIVCSKPTENMFHVEQNTFDSDWSHSNVPRGTSQKDSGRFNTRNRHNVLRGTFFRKVRKFFGVSKGGPQKDSRNTLVFVEVKTLNKGSLMPEDNITPAKMRRLIRSCQLYLSSREYDLEDTDWQIDTVGIVVDKEKGTAKIDHLEQAIYL